MSRHSTTQPVDAPIEQQSSALDVTAQPLQIPAVCFIADVVRILRVARRTVERLRRHGAFPIAELPALDKRPRWSGAAVEAFLRESSTHQGVSRFHNRNRRARTA